MNKLFLILLFLLITNVGFTQGFNTVWLLGNDPGWPNLGRMIFTDTSYTLLNEQRKMSFKGTQATMSDANGSFLMSSNGVWIANANNDTMMNGTGLNPGYFVNTFPNGLVITNGNIIIPYPDDSTKYVLFHQTRLDPASSLHGIYMSIVDLTLDNGLGAVISKNDTLIEDSLSWGIAACKHANGRDWWVVVMRDGADEVYKILLTPQGISSITTQILGFIAPSGGNASQITFSQDGSRFIYSFYQYNGSPNSFVVLIDFDRCTGQFSNSQTLNIVNGSYLLGLAFSSSGNFAYANSSTNTYQINTVSLNVVNVAIYDGFISGFPPTCCATTFFMMYLAKNGKIYGTSGNGVQHLHEMNYPDSSGAACDVQQHAIGWQNYYHSRAVPNHPNYNLGPVLGSVCDSLALGLSEYDHDFKLNLFPNPTTGIFNISYSLPNNIKGSLEVFDIYGRLIYNMYLPQWSTQQLIRLPENISNGIYNCTITSGESRVSKRVMIFRE
jgi:type IX secretion system substrate protein